MKVDLFQQTIDELNKNENFKYFVETGFGRRALFRKAGIYSFDSYRESSSIVGYGRISNLYAIFTKSTVFNGTEARLHLIEIGSKGFMPYGRVDIYTADSEELQKQLKDTFDRLRDAV